RGPTPAHPWIQAKNWPRKRLRATRSSLILFSSGMNANQPDRPGLVRNAYAAGNNRHRPLLSRTLTTESVGRGFEPRRPRWKRLSSTLENGGLVRRRKKAA